LVDSGVADALLAEELPRCEEKAFARTPAAASASRAFRQ